MKLFVVVVSAGVALSLGAAILAAPQQPQDRPGVVNQPRVIVENRGPGQAIPVTVQGFVNTDRPVNVQVVGSLPILVRRQAQTWSYRTVTVPSGQEMGAALDVAGGDGWEASGVTSGPAGTVVLLKRPR